MKFYFVIISSLFLSFITCNQLLPKVPLKEVIQEPPSFDSQPNFNHFNLLNQNEFSIRSSFYLKFLRFKVKIDLIFFYNHFGELDFEYTPNYEHLVLFSRNFKNHKAAKSFLVLSVHNIAFQFLIDMMKIAQNTAFVKNLPKIKR